jgi:hypothetical protein
MTAGDWSVGTGALIPISNGGVASHYDVVTISNLQDSLDATGAVNTRLDALFIELSEMTMNEALTNKSPQIRGLAKFIQRSISENATNEPRSQAVSCESTSDVKF